jgi:hypothetical protein
MIEWNCHTWPRPGRVTRAEGSIGYAPGLGGPQPILSRVTVIGTDDLAPSMASDLEAFSR